MDVFRIGATEAMVDSGAKNSVICQSLLSGRSAFAIRPPLLYQNIDGSLVRNIVGKCSLTVRYKGVLVDLNHVVVVKSDIYPLVLGVEWIVQSGAVIKGICGRVEVPMSNQTCGLESIEGVHRRLDRVALAQDVRQQNLEVENAKINEDLNNFCRKTVATTTVGQLRTSSFVTPPIDQTAIFYRLGKELQEEGQKVEQLGAANTHHTKVLANVIYRQPHDQTVAVMQSDITRNKDILDTAIVIDQSHVAPWLSSEEDFPKRWEETPKRKKPTGKLANRSKAIRGRDFYEWKSESSSMSEEVVDISRYLPPMDVDDANTAVIEARTVPPSVQRPEGVDRSPLRLGPEEVA